MGKHLCGLATDLTLRCYVTAAQRSGEDVRGEEQGQSGEPAGAALALALCCHHLCDYAGYVAQPLLERHGIGAAEFAPDSVFGVMTPKSCPGVPSELLDPAKSWADPAEFHATQSELASLFTKNFEKYESEVADDVCKQGPKVT